MSIPRNELSGHIPSEILESSQTRVPGNCLQIGRTDNRASCSHNRLAKSCQHACCWMKGPWWSASGLCYVRGNGVKRSPQCQHKTRDRQEGGSKKEGGWQNLTRRSPPHGYSIVTTSITDRKKFSVNCFLQFLTGSLPENIPSKLIRLLFGPITENTLPFTDPMTTLGPKFHEQSPAMNYRMKLPQQLIR